MKLSVIILNYNVSPFLEQCLYSVQRALSGISSEIIVVDNASVDDSEEMLKQKFPKICLIKNTENLGFAKGNNIGVSYAKGKYICILNPDTVVSEETFEKVLSFSEHKSNLGIVGVRLIDGSGAFLPESKRNIPTPWIAFTKFSGLNRIMPKEMKSYYASQIGEFETGPVEILVGAFMFLQKDLFTRLGGFDEGCFMYSDDVDLSYLSLKAGYQNFYLGSTTVLHYKGESTSKDGVFLKRFQDGMRFFYTKHFKRGVWLPYLISWGIQLFSICKLSRFQKKNSRSPRIRQFLFLGENVEKLLLLQTHHRHIVLQMKSIEELHSFLKKKAKYAPSQLIIDGNKFSNSQIIHLIQELKPFNINYRIWPASCDFIIGGDKRDGFSEVVFLHRGYSKNKQTKICAV